MIPSYPEEFSYRPPFILADRFTNWPAYIGSIPEYLLPTVILVIFNYYKKQKETAILLEKKRTSELNALKNQLNPHFLFNTLNNLYVLSLKKSDKAPEVIAKLSEILDYLLYQCNSNYVSLKHEISLLHNYIDLEEVRYGNRVKVSFNKEISNDAKIAPLLLLTFLENAFKHGVTQEINVASIEIYIKGDAQNIEFRIVNTRPANSENNQDANREAIGLKNVKKQLDLLYPNSYKLDIDNKPKMYSVNLKITSNAL
ncbi:sensor histidine kinase [Formosa sp. S-31]|uniref:sensor histidine kinase n=1 Tax=Formosa sp. S-31 TaxID=2790949 RepID=UPI003EB7005A